jgi:hypothetical protein
MPLQLPAVALLVGLVVDGGEVGKGSTLHGFLLDLHLDHLEPNMGANSTPASMRALIRTAGKTAFLASLKAMGVKSSTDRKTLLSSLVNSAKRDPEPHTAPVKQSTSSAQPPQPVSPAATAPMPMPMPTRHSQKPAAIHVKLSPPSKQMPAEGAQGASQPLPALPPSTNRVAVCITGEQRAATCPPRDPKVFGSSSPLDCLAGFLEGIGDRDVFVVLDTPPTPEDESVANAGPSIGPSLLDSATRVRNSGVRILSGFELAPPFRPSLRPNG